MIDGFVLRDLADDEEDREEKNGGHDSVRERDEGQCSEGFRE